MNKLIIKKIALYVSVYLLFLAVTCGAFTIIAIIGCGLNNCYDCCLNRFFTEILSTFEGFCMMNWFVLPGIALFIIIDVIDEIRIARKVKT